MGTGEQPSRVSAEEVTRLQHRVSELETELAQARGAAIPTAGPAGLYGFRAWPLLEAVTDGLAALDHDLRCLWVNQAFASMLGLARESVLGRRLAELLPDLADNELHQRCRKALETHTAEEFECATPIRGRWCRHRVYPNESGCVVFSQEIGARQPAGIEQRILAATADAVIALDPDNRVTFFNAAAERLYRIQASEVIGQPLSASYTYWWFHPDEEVSAQQELSASGGWSGEAVHVRRDGSAFSVHATVNVLPESGGGGLVAVVREIGDDKRAERERAERSVFLDAITGVAPVLLYVYDLEKARNVWVNGALPSILGYTPDELAAMGDNVLSMLLHPDDAGRHPAHLERLAALPDGHTANFEYRMRHKDGSWVWLSSSERSFRRDATTGRLVQIVGSAQDITRRKQAEADTANAARLLQTIVESTTDLVWVKDTEGRMTFGNPATFALLGGGDPKRVLGYDAHQLVPDPDHARQILENDARILAADKAEMVEEAFGDPQSPLVFQTIKGPLRTTEGRVVGMVGVSRDVTELRRRETAIRESEQRLQLAKAAADLAIYDCDPSTGRISWDDGLRALWGLGPDEQVTFEAFLEGVHPDDRERVRLEVERSLDPQGGSVFHSTYRVINRNDRCERWVEIKGQVLFEQSVCTRFIGTVLDITAHKQNEQALAIAAERAEIAQEAASAALFEIEPNRGRVFRSPMLARLVGHRPEELPPTVDGWRQLVEPDDQARFDVAMASVMKDGADLSLEYRVRHKDGHTVWVADQGRAIRNDRGEITRVIGLVSDITARKQVQQALEESEARFRTMADASPSIIWVTDAEGRLQFMNQAYRDFCGVTDDEVCADRWPLVVHPDDRERYVAEFLRAVQDRSPFYSQCRLRRADGEWRWIASYGTPRFSSDGTFLGHVGSSPDVHDLITTQQALRESEERFRTLADNMSQLAWMTDETGWVVWYNRRWYEYTGTTLDQMEGWGWKAVHHPDHVARVMEHLQHCFATGEPWEDTFPLRGEDGSYCWFLSRATPIRDAVSGKILRWFGTCTDITDRLKTEQRLRRANEDLENFAHSVSHDLQEPLRNVALSAELLQRDHEASLGGNAARYLQFIVEGARRMSSMVSDVLAYSRVALEEDTPIEPVETKAVLQQVLRNLQHAIDASSGEVICGELPPVSVRHAHLQQLLQNLIGNALKYAKESEPPRIEIAVTAEGDKWRFSVSDNGIGIPAEFQNKIFGMLRRLHGDSRKYAGNGIGLAICQRIVERYGGRIWVESEPGTGSCFHFTLPAAPR